MVLRYMSCSINGCQDTGGINTHLDVYIYTTCYQDSSNCNIHGFIVQQGTVKWREMWHERQHLLMQIKVHWDNELK